MLINCIISTSLDATYRPDILLKITTILSDYVLVFQMTPKSKRKSIHSRMLRPVSRAFGKQIIIYLVNILYDIVHYLSALYYTN